MACGPTNIVRRQRYHLGRDSDTSPCNVHGICPASLGLSFRRRRLPPRRLRFPRGLVISRGAEGRALSLLTSFILD